MTFNFRRRWDNFGCGIREYNQRGVSSPPDHESEPHYTGRGFHGFGICLLIRNSHSICLPRERFRRHQYRGQVGLSSRESPSFVSNKLNFISYRENSFSGLNDLTSVIDATVIGRVVLRWRLGLLAYIYL